LYHKKIVGTVEQYPDASAARLAVAGLISEINPDARPTSWLNHNCPTLRSLRATRAVEGKHLAQSRDDEDLQRAYLNHWVRPHWQKYTLAEVRPMYSTLLRSVGTEFKVMQELLRHSSLRSTLDVYTQAITPAKHAAQAAVVSLVFSSDANAGSPSAGQEIAPA
jgi:hypothetical protein